MAGAETLQHPADETANIALALARQARRLGDRPAVVEGDRATTFAQLDADVDLLAHGLAANGIGVGVKAVLMVRPSLEFFALTFAMLRVGAVPVMVDPGMGRASLGLCLAEARPQAFVGISLAHVARIVLGWGRPTVRTLVTVGRRWFWGGLTLDSVRERGRQVGGGRPYTAGPTSAAAPAAVLFTSGSTGVPKGAEYSHGIFAAQVAALDGHFRFRPGDIDVPTFPLFALFDAALGVTAVIPDMDFTRPAQVDPEEILKTVIRHGATQMFGSPALLDRVARHAVAHGVKLPTLRRVISAGAPVAPSILERFASLLPADGLIHTPYGATEALPVCSIDSREILGETAALSRRGEGTCVGRPLPGIDLALIRIDDGPIARWSEALRVPDGEVGEIVVRGPVVTQAYHGRDDLTRLAKIPSDGAAGVWHRMGDLGKRDAQGRVWFCGRKSHRLRTPSGPMYTIPCEAIFNGHPRVRRSALVGLGAAGSHRPVICIELEEGGVPEKSDAVRLTAELLDLAARHDHTASIQDVRFHPGFPVDVRHNAKIFREKLTVWASMGFGR